MDLKMFSVGGDMTFVFSHCDVNVTGRRRTVVGGRRCTKYDLASSPSC